MHIDISSDREVGDRHATLDDCRKWVLDSMKSSVIKLPEKDGKPDWRFTENYMKSLPMEIEYEVIVCLKI